MGSLDFIEAVLGSQDFDEVVLGSRDFIEAVLGSQGRQDECDLGRRRSTSSLDIDGASLLHDLVTSPHVTIAFRLAQLVGVCERRGRGGRRKWHGRHPQEGGGSARRTQEGVGSPSSSSYSSGEAHPGGNMGM